MNSMTGFARAEVHVDSRAFRLEVRSFNHRFLDARVRLPHADGLVETQALEAVRRQLTRGRVELSVFDEVTDAAPSALRLNVGVARDVGKVLHQLAEVVGCDLATAARLLPPVRDLVSGGGEPLRSDALWAALEPALSRALGELRSMRAQEGQALKRDLVGQLDQLCALAVTIKGIVAGLPQQWHARLHDRLTQLSTELTVDPARLAQEVALLADRTDVHEELARLESHEEQLRQMFDEEGAVGRKVEFMIQELNRELNTIAAKVPSADVAALVVEAKGCLERMREQAQNIE
ncbi:MAG: YicC family protein [Deltaproteobacteria bacterium]|nr:YicC family protein [Deltaproteobacteria bacterium]